MKIKLHRSFYVLTTFWLSACGSDTKQITHENIFLEPPSILHCTSAALDVNTKILSWRAQLEKTESLNYTLELQRSYAVSTELIDLLGQDLRQISTVAEAQWDVDNAVLQLIFDDGVVELIRQDGLGWGIYTGKASFEEDFDIDLSCWEENYSTRFSYDASTGRCLDSAGVEGRNNVNVEFVRETGNGNCANLANLELNEGDLSYPSWTGFDLRGADLSGSDLYFAHILDSQLEGALIADLNFGYADVTGSVDEYTTFPEGGSCTLLDNSLISCRQQFAFLTMTVSD